MNTTDTVDALPKIDPFHPIRLIRAMRTYRRIALVAVLQGPDLGPVEVVPACRANSAGHTRYLRRWRDDIAPLHRRRRSTGEHRYSITENGTMRGYAIRIR